MTQLRKALEAVSRAGRPQLVQGMIYYLPDYDGPRDAGARALGFAIIWTVFWVSLMIWIFL